jgi:hypothetical protein
LRAARNMPSGLTPVPTNISDCRVYYKDIVKTILVFLVSLTIGLVVPNPAWPTEEEAVAVVVGSGGGELSTLSGSPLLQLEHEPSDTAGVSGST